MLSWENAPPSHKHGDHHTSTGTHSDLSPTGTKKRRHLPLCGTTHVGSRGRKNETPQPVAVVVMHIGGYTAAAGGDGDDSDRDTSRGRVLECLETTAGLLA